MRHILLTSTILATLFSGARADDTPPIGRDLDIHASASKIERKITVADIRVHDMLNPTVRIEALGARGSGEIIHSGPDGTFVITNHHVISGEMKVVLAEAVKQHHKLPLKVMGRNWMVTTPGEAAVPVILEMNLVADDPVHDLALFKVADTEWRAPYVARAIDEKDAAVQTEDAFVAGSGLGNRPFVTAGLISLTSVMADDERDGLIMVSAPIISGNSGGGAFIERNGHYVMIGVPEAIAANKEGKSVVGVPHMGYFIPMSTVRTFLKKVDMEDLLDAPKTTVAN